MLQRVVSVVMGIVQERILEAKITWHSCVAARISARLAGDSILAVLTELFFSCSNVLPSARTFRAQVLQITVDFL